MLTLLVVKVIYIERPNGIGIEDSAESRARLFSFPSKITHEWIQLPLKRVEYITVSIHIHSVFLCAYSSKREKESACMVHEMKNEKEGKEKERK